MNRFFIPGATLTQGGTVQITDAQDIQHIHKVLRLKAGDQLEVSDGADTEAVAEIVGLTKSEVTVRIETLSQAHRESPLEIVLYQGLPKGQKLEVVFQKNTEIGVRGFVPLITERCVVKLTDPSSDNKKWVRWQMIIDEAAKQSKRGKLPGLTAAMNIDEALKTLADFDLVLVPHVGEGTCPLGQVISAGAVRRVAVFIGPEGGFTDREVEAIVQAGGKAVTLGPRILRTETAGFVINSILQYACGDMGGLKQ